MGKSYCAVGCSNRYTKGCGLEFYRFSKDSKRRRQWIAAVNRKNWEPNEICSSHFVGGKKSNDLTSPAYSPSIFSHVKSPKKRKAEEDLRRFFQTYRKQGGGLKDSRERKSKFRKDKEKEKKLKRQKE